MDSTTREQILERCELIRFCRRELDRALDIHRCDKTEYDIYIDRLDSAAREIAVLIDRIRDVESPAVDIQQVTTGRLENWSYALNKLHGDIYDDTKERFTNGTMITTSTIQNPLDLKEGAYARTRNSVYLLGKEA